jgi:hypothetical protein
MNQGKKLLVVVTVIAAFTAGAAESKFEVASVKKINPNAAPGAKGADPGRGGGGAPLRVDQGRFTYTSSLFGFILRAYGIQGCSAQSDCALVSGGPDRIKPDWIKKDTFEIQAKIPDGAPVYTTGQFSNGQAPQLQLMLGVGGSIQSEGPSRREAAFRVLPYGREKWAKNESQDSSGYHGPTEGRQLR